MNITYTLCHICTVICIYTSIITINMIITIDIVFIYYYECLISVLSVQQSVNLVC